MLSLAQMELSPQYEVQCKSLTDLIMHKTTSLTATKNYISLLMEKEILRWKRIRFTFGRAKVLCLSHFPILMEVLHVHYFSPTMDRCLSTRSKLKKRSKNF